MYFKSLHTTAIAVMLFQQGQHFAKCKGLPLKTHTCTCVYTSLSTLFIYIYLECNVSLPLNNIYIHSHNTETYCVSDMKVYVHMLQHVYIHFCVCIRALKAQYIGMQVFQRAAAKSKQCHNSKKKAKGNIAEFMVHGFIKAVSL